MTTAEELDCFVAFARNRIEDGKQESLVQLWERWESLREDPESIAAIGEGLAEARAGEGVPVAEAFAEIRAKLGHEP